MLRHMGNSLASRRHRDSAKQNMLYSPIYYANKSIVYAIEAQFNADRAWWLLPTAALSWLSDSGSGLRRVVCRINTAYATDCGNKVWCDGMTDPHSAGIKIEFGGNLWPRHGWPYYCLHPTHPFTHEIPAACAASQASSPTIIKSIFGLG